MNIKKSVHLTYAIGWVWANTRDTATTIKVTSRPVTSPSLLGPFADPKFKSESHTQQSVRLTNSTMEGRNIYGRDISLERMRQLLL